MTTEEIIKKSFYDLYKKAGSDTMLFEDLGLNEAGRNKLGLIVEMYLQTEGCRPLTDAEIKSWKTIGDITRTVEAVKGI